MWKKLFSRWFDTKKCEEKKVPEFHYEDNVKIVSGFHKGLTGTVLNKRYKMTYYVFKSSDVEEQYSVYIKNGISGFFVEVSPYEIERVNNETA